jgi:hypothetical protein
MSPDAVTAHVASRIVGRSGPGGFVRVVVDGHPATDRSTRAPRVRAAKGTIVILAGSLLLGHPYDVDLRVHLALTRNAETRGTALTDAWQLAAYDRYRREVAPERSADVVVRSDDPRHPALVRR